MSPGPPDTRASLIVRLSDAADAAAWDEFVALYAPVVVRLARRQGLQPSDCDDLLQEVLTSVAQSVQQWLSRSDRGPFRAWLFRIARNAAVNQLTRRATRMLAVGGSDASQKLREHATKFADTDFDLEYRREAFRFAAQQVRESVTDTTWQAFWLTHVEGRDVADVASQLRISSGSIYVARSRVMSRLKDSVNQYEDGQ